MSSFYSRIKDALKGWMNGEPRYRTTGSGNIRIAARDLDQLLSDYDRLDSRARLDHAVHQGADLVVTITGGKPSDRAGVSNGLLLNLVLMGYSLDDNVPTWDEGVTYLRLIDTNKVREPLPPPPVKPVKYPLPSWPVNFIGTPQDVKLKARNQLLP